MCGYIGDKITEMPQLAPTFNVRAYTAVPSARQAAMVAVS